MSTETSAPEGVIARIAKLRELAKSANVNEAMVAAKAAARLIERYRIDEAALEAAGEEGKYTVASEPLFRCKALQAWEGQLAIGVAVSFGCYAYACGVPRPGRGTQIEIVGRASDVELVRYLFTWLRGELMRICERDHKAAETKFKKADWYQGAALGVYEQLQRGRQVARAETQATTAALARIDARSAEAEAFAEALGNVPMVSRPEPTDAAAYYRGKEAGLRVHLGDKLTEGTTHTRLAQTNDRR